MKDYFDKRKNSDHFFVNGFFAAKFVNIFRIHDRNVILRGFGEGEKICLVIMNEWESKETEREREVCVSMNVCVCVRERERESKIQH